MPQDSELMADGLKPFFDLFNVKKGEHFRFLKDLQALFPEKLFFL
jgi:hypothetical protein